MLEFFTHYVYIILFIGMFFYALKFCKKIYKYINYYYTFVLRALGLSFVSGPRKVWTGPESTTCVQRVGHDNDVVMHP